MSCSESGHVEPAPSCGKLAVLSPLLKLSLEVGSNCRHQEVPDGRNRQEGEIFEVSVIDELGVVEQLRCGDDGGERGVLEHANEFIAGRRNDKADGLGNDDAT